MMHLLEVFDQATSDENGFVAFYHDSLCGNVTRCKCASRNSYLWTASKQTILPKDDKHRLLSFLSWLLQEIHEIPG